MNEIITISLGTSETDAQIMVYMDCLYADADVGLAESFEITGLDILSYGGHKGNDGSLNDFSEGLFDLVNRDADLYETLVEAALNQADKY